MFVKNLKMKNKGIFKLAFIILITIVLAIFVIAFSQKNVTRKENVTDKINTKGISSIATQNYTNVLKTVHENLDEYVGKKIKFTGFVYRLYDFNPDQFVLGREMIISSNYQAVVAGFLCHLNEAEKYKDGTWVTLEGTIKKGNYHGEIPMIEVYKIEETTAPNDEYVYPPSEGYIPTAKIL